MFKNEMESVTPADFPGGYRCHENLKGSTLKAPNKMLPELARSPYGIKGGGGGGGVLAWHRFASFG